MGEATRRKQRGEYPATRERFKAGPVKVGTQYFYLDEGGRVYRMVRSRRVQHPRITELVRDAARKRDSRIVRPAGGELVRP